jgi:hypothetical protein
MFSIGELFPSKMDWIHETEILVRLLDRASEMHSDRFSYRYFLSLVRYFHPGSGYPEMRQEEFEQDKTAFARFLLDIPEPERVRIYEQFARDVQRLFPVPAQHLLDELGCGEEAPVPFCLEKFNRYLKWVDAAILSKRYVLALYLAHRLLDEYYRDFLREKDLVQGAAAGDLHFMSITVCRYVAQYFRERYIPYSERRVMLIARVSEVLARLRRTSGAARVDKSQAMYARDNVRRIVRFLSRF